MATTAEAFQMGLQLHQAGKLAEAEVIYRKILQVEPAHAGTLHLMGLLAHQVGRHDVAVEAISQAIRLCGNEPIFHSNLGEAYRGLGKLKEAVQCFRQAVRLNPDFAVAYNNLGNVLGALGQPSEAEAAYREAIRCAPAYADPHSNLGTILQAKGNLDAAIAHYREAVRINPRYVAGYYNLVGALAANGHLAEAAECYERLCVLVPDDVDIRVGLGTLLQMQGKFEEAIACYREALSLDPRCALASNNLGAARKDQGRLEEALAHYRATIAMDPGFHQSFYNMGIVLAEQEKSDDAIAAFEEALRLKPDFVDAMCNYGNLLEQLGRYDEALGLFDRALELKPNSPSVYLNRGNVLRKKGMYNEAVAAYRDALRVKPFYPEAYNNLAITYNDMSQPDEAIETCQAGLEQSPRAALLYSSMAIALHTQGRSQEAIDRYRKVVELIPEDAAQHSNLLYSLNFVDNDPQAVFDEHLHWARLHAEPLTALARPHANQRKLDKRLRIGYTTAFFRQHAVNFFTEPMLAAHDHQNFEIFCYSDAGKGDAATQRVKRTADAWRDVEKLTDEKFAELVRQDQIDIFVDLTGHIARNRLLVFARKPAPVQVTYLGYQNTTGMTAMDYRLTDELADPPGKTDRFYTEQLVRLPRSYFCYRPSDNSPPLVPLGALERGVMTFGSFNNYAKMTPAVVDTWLTILTRVPRSRLLVLAYKGGYLERHLHERARERGIEPDRVELCEKRPRNDYLRLQQQADIALDPFPFNGHTTTCDSIWMGVPAVKMEGETYASRFGGSVLANVGLSDLIARTPAQYIEIAVKLAGDLDRLTDLRSSLRKTMLDSVLLDFAGFTGSVEQAYRDMWWKWCEL